jgi:hypothetical protein
MRIRGRRRCESSGARAACARTLIGAITLQRARIKAHSEGWGARLMRHGFFDIVSAAAVNDDANRRCYYTINIII